MVNLCEEWGGRKKLYDRLGMVQVQLPTVDRTYPSQRHCDAGVQAMRHHIERCVQLVWGSVCRDSFLQ